MKLLAVFTLFTAALAATGSSCATASSAGGDVATDTAAAHAQVIQLEAAARALAKTDGCNAATQCRTAALGHKACGGPRTYLVYCAATTDSAALFSKLAQLDTAERAYNALTGSMSTCEFRMPPTVEAQGGSCRASQ